MAINNIIKNVQATLKASLNYQESSNNFLLQTQKFVHPDFPKKNALYHIGMGHFLNIPNFTIIAVEISLNYAGRIDHPTQHRIQFFRNFIFIKYEGEVKATWG